MTRKPLIRQPVIDEFYSRRGDHFVTYDAGLLDLCTHRNFGVVQAKVQVYTNPLVYMVMLVGCDDAVDLSALMTPEVLQRTRAYLTENFNIEVPAMEHMRWADISQQEEDMLVLDLTPPV